MKISAGQTVVLTGASGGLGKFMAHALADRGLNLALVAYPGVELEELRQALTQRGARAIALTSDLRDPAQRHSMIEQVREEFKTIDILVNNAGVEFTSSFHDLTEQQVDEILAVNLEAPMVLTRLVLPEMLRRGRGHIVNISSLAARSGPAFQEPYAATKAALVGFTASLRASYRSSGVGASVILPGFVDAGIYANLKARTGCSAPAVLGISAPETVARAVVRSIERDLPEVIVNPLPVRPLFALCALFPSFGEWLIDQTGANAFFAKVVAALRKTTGVTSSEITTRK